MARKDEPSKFGGYFASPLRYPGGKGRLGPWLATVLAANKLTGGWYLEPYAGGAGAALYLLFERHVEHIVINDADPLIHAFWQSVVSDSKAFAALIEETPVTMESRERFTDMVANPAAHSRLELGFAAFFLNRTSRSGILKGGVIGGKKQEGKYKLDARYSVDDLVQRVKAIGRSRSQITVLGMDALEMLLHSVPGLPQPSLIYLDPPYYVKGSQLYRNHYAHADHAGIAHYVSTLSTPVLVTYDDCPEIRALYEGINSATFSLRYSTHLSRPQAREVMFYANLEMKDAPALTRGAQLGSRSGDRHFAESGVPV